MAHKDPIPEYEHKLLEVSYTFTANATFELECLCLTTIRPSGHISRPSQVGFSHSCLCSASDFESPVL